MASAPQWVDPCAALAGTPAWYDCAFAGADSGSAGLGAVVPGLSGLATATLLPTGASYVQLPAGYPSDLIKPYMKNGGLFIPNGQGLLTDVQKAWLMTAMQLAINQNAKQPYNINFGDRNSKGQLDNSGVNIINSQIDPKWVSYHGGMSGQPGWVNNGNYDFLNVPALAANIKQPWTLASPLGGILIGVLTYVIPPAGAVMAASVAATKADQAAQNTTGIAPPLSSDVVNSILTASTQAAAANVVSNASQGVVTISSTTNIIPFIIIGIILFLLFYKKGK